MYEFWNDDVVCPWSDDDDLELRLLLFEFDSIDDGDGDYDSQSVDEYTTCSGAYGISNPFVWSMWRRGVDGRDEVCELVYQPHWYYARCRLRHSQ